MVDGITLPPTMLFPGQLLTFDGNRYTNELLMFIINLQARLIRGKDKCPQLKMKWQQLTAANLSGMLA
jgi:hypothetical protein